MQHKKEEHRKRIISAAETLFMDKGFAATSMREIAAKANVGLSNIYNYFQNKDEIYREILRPLINRLYKIVYEHNIELKLPEFFVDVEMKRKQIEEYVELAESYRAPLKLLLFHSQGSSLSNFREEYTQKMTSTIQTYLQDVKRVYPHLNVNMSEYFIHLNTSYMFMLLEEIVRRHIEKEKLKIFITEYISFEIAGLKELMHA